MQMRLAGISVDVVRKNIKNVHLGVHPPVGRVRVAAPEHLSPDAIRAFVVTRLPWIRRQQAKMKAQERETPREYINRESHYVWGKRYLLKVQEIEAKPSVELTPSWIVLSVRPGTRLSQRQEIMEQWYRDQVRSEATALIRDNERKMGIKVNRLHVQRMKTKWGGCNPKSHAIRLNTDLGKAPRECLEYIVAHEMLHMIERTHGHRFVELMNKYIPNWQSPRQALSSLPLREYEHRLIGENN